MKKRCNPGLFGKLGTGILAAGAAGTAGYLAWKWWRGKKTIDIYYNGAATYRMENGQLAKHPIEAFSKEILEKGQRYGEVSVNMFIERTVPMSTQDAFSDGMVSLFDATVPFKINWRREVAPAGAFPIYTVYVDYDGSNITLTHNGKTLSIGRSEVSESFTGSYTFLGLDLEFDLYVGTILSLQSELGRVKIAFRSRSHVSRTDIDNILHMLYDILLERLNAEGDILPPEFVMTEITTEGKERVIFELPPLSIPENRYFEPVTTIL